MTHPYTIRPVTGADREWIARFAAEQWGSDKMVAHGQVFYLSRLEGFIAESGGEVVGLATYQVSGAECELTSLDSLREGLGVGSALIDAVKDAARRSGCQRLFLITTNDNTHALRFYQRCGFILRALRPGAVDESRKLKPEIPLLGNDGIPIRDELELETAL